MAIIQKRQPGKKFWIADMLNAEQGVNEQGFKTFNIRDREATRVNLMAVVISKYSNDQGSYATATIDDGSGQIRLKAWNEDTLIFDKLNIGDIALVVGRLNVNDTNKELFIRPELIRPISTEWMKLRLAELKKEFGAPEAKEAAEPEAPSIPEQVSEETSAGVTLAAREKVLQAMEKNNGPDGAELLKVIKDSGLQEQEAQAAINELIMEGEAFQPKQGYIKLIS